jgi:hypothetical protein
VGINLEVLVKLVQDETHAVHEAVHVRWCAVVVGRALVGCEGFLESLKVLHPFKCKGMGLDISFVEDDNEGKLGLVQDAGGGRIAAGLAPWDKCKRKPPTYMHRAYLT